ncbi:MAG: homing endonuclease associated repeat-containing protein [Eubacteriales bacterium]
MISIKYTREDCIALLQKKQEELNHAGLNRFPQRSDFANDEVVAIKAFLGPWPRALEAAGLKEPRGEDRLQKNREKRARAKKRLREAKKAEKAAAAAEKTNGEG